MPAIAWLILIPAAIIGLFPATLRADVAGVASVIDGDTIVVHGQRMSPVGGRPDVARRWSELLLLAEGVEEVPRVRNFETMIQNPGRC